MNTQKLEALVEEAVAWADEREYDAPLLDPVLEKVGVPEDGDRGFWLGEVLTYIGDKADRLPRRDADYIHGLIDQFVR